MAYLALKLVRKSLLLKGVDKYGGKITLSGRKMFLIFKKSVKSDKYAESSNYKIDNLYYNY